MPREDAEAQAQVQAHSQREMQQLDGTAQFAAATGPSSPLTQVRSPFQEAVEGRSNSRIARLSSDQVIEVAEQHARRSGSSEEHTPERHLKATRHPSTDGPVERGGSVILPVLEEVGEGGSLGGRSRTSGNSRERPLSQREHDGSKREINSVKGVTGFDTYDQGDGASTGRDRQTYSSHSNAASSNNASISTNTPGMLAPRTHLSPPLGGRPPPTPPKDVPSPDIDTTAESTTTSTTVDEAPPVLPMPELTSPLNIGRRSWLAS